MHFYAFIPITFLKTAVYGNISILHINRVQGSLIQMTSGKKKKHKHTHNIHLLLYMHDKEFDEERVIFLGGNIVIINFRM